MAPLELVFSINTKSIDLSRLTTCVAPTLPPVLCGTPRAIALYTRYVWNTYKSRLIVHLPFSIETLLSLCVFCVGPLCAVWPSGGGSSVGSSPLCGSPVGGVSPLTCPRSMWHLLAWCLALVHTLPHNSNILWSCGSRVNPLCWYFVPPRFYLELPLRISLLSCMGAGLPSSIFSSFVGRC